ncbi:hypothetical protein HHK36_026099 [Tetracentron sinense]|uniref:Auxin efflux carrier component n=1 Tax=Tetracentron sinense TaxID=13715 RepID=A0A835D711_TETSI|nr:hypothetical protein HHK36_026099 [Tetracentron sinense]
MITGKAIYEVLVAIVPLYVAMILAYGSVRWWKIFTPDQCSGINRFVAIFAVPLLSFHFISSNDPYAMNYRFILADSFQKIVILFALFLWQTLSKNGSLEWMITLFSLSTLPNTLVMGIPLLKAMYGEFSGSLMVQIVVLQSVIWYTLMLIMFEYRGAKLFINEKFPNTTGSITSVRVESDVVSFNGQEPLEADVEICNDGNLHVVVKRSTSLRSSVSSYNKYHGLNSVTSITPQASISNLSGVEIYSIQSSREPTPRSLSLNQTKSYAMYANMMLSPKHNYTNSFQGSADDVYSLRSSRAEMPRISNFDGEMMRFANKRVGKISSPYNPMNPMLLGTTSGGGSKKEGGGVGSTHNKELHMFVWSSGGSSISEGNLREAGNSVVPTNFGVVDSSKAILEQEIAASRESLNFSENFNLVKKIRDREIKVEDGSKPTESTFLSQKRLEDDNQMPPASVMTRLILTMVWRKLIRNPNTYASILGLAWSVISFRWHIQMPSIVKGSIAILSNAGLGMAMFSLGFFMALQPKMIACGKTIAIFSMAVRFLIGPAVIAATSFGIGIRGDLLRVAILQAALPQGIVPFVFAKEYNVHAEILSTSVIFGMLIALPITILYYFLLGL